MYMKYEPGEYCILLYQLGEQIVVGHLRWQDGAVVPPSSKYRIETIGMDIYPYPADPWLPGLVTASDPKVIASALAHALPECQSGLARVLRVQVIPQRYRPGKRLTLRLNIHLWDLSRGGIFTRTYYGKVYHDPKKASSVYQEMQLLAEIAPVREGKVLLAGAAAYLPDLSMVLQEPVNGTPLEDLIGRMDGPGRTGDPRALSGMRRAAAALAAVHTAGLETKRHRPILDELARFQKRAAKIESVDTAQGALLGELAAALPAWLPWLDEWGAGLSLIHGDCKPSQFLIGDERVAILDFDHTGMADPANDGTFLATLRQLAQAAQSAWRCAFPARRMAAGLGEAVPGRILRRTWMPPAAVGMVFACGRSGEAAGLLARGLREKPVLPAARSDGRDSVALPG
jgi:hypothetical protein